MLVSSLTLCIFQMANGKNARAGDEVYLNQSMSFGITNDPIKVPMYTKGTVKQTNGYGYAWVEFQDSEEGNTTEAVFIDTKDLLTKEQKDIKLKEMKSLQRQKDIKLKLQRQKDRLNKSQNLLAKKAAKKKTEKIEYVLFAPKVLENGKQETKRIFGKNEILQSGTYGNVVRKFATGRYEVDFHLNCGPVVVDAEDLDLEVGQDAAKKNFVAKEETMKRNNEFRRRAARTKESPKRSLPASLDAIAFKGWVKKEIARRENI